MFKFFCDCFDDVFCFFGWVGVYCVEVLGMNGWVVLLWLFVVVLVFIIVGIFGFFVVMGCILLFFDVG